MSGRRATVVLAILAALTAAGCRSLAPRLDPTAAAAAIDVLGVPLQGHPVALYRLEVPATRALRLSLQTAPGGGRMTVSEPFGSALSLLAWGASGPTEAYDLSEGCRDTGAGLEEVLGVGALPVQAAVRLLGGLLPAAAGAVALGPDGRLHARGDGWEAVVAVLPDPWRVVDVRAADRAWRVQVLAHDGCIPTHLRVGRGRLHRVELELVGMEWDTLDQLVEPPTLPPCGAR